MEKGTEKQKKNMIKIQSLNEVLSNKTVLTLASIKGLHSTLKFLCTIDVVNKKAAVFTYNIVGAVHFRIHAPSVVCHSLTVMKGKK